MKKKVGTMTTLYVVYEDGRYWYHGIVDRFLSSGADYGVVCDARDGKRLHPQKYQPAVFRNVQRKGDKRVTVHCGKDGLFLIRIPDEIVEI